MHADYTIAWICALPLEAAAARVMLDKIHNPLPQPSNDSNAYVLGELNGHCIVVACLPTGVYGTVSAATVVSYLRSTFTRIEFGLMVGIGGGVPQRSNDIRLGDVVVCKPVGKHSGVIQYDYGKAVQGGQFMPTGSLNKPPQVLLTHMAQLEAKQITKKDSVILRIMEKVLEENPDMKGRFSPPDQQTDLLFSSSYYHAENENDCANCDKTRSLHRQPRDTRAPYIHYGLIASGDQVMKDSEARDRLAEQHGILCFEMEAAGLMDGLPTLVIRGICDYCDSHKLKEWQGYAALTAAAYAKVLLSDLPVSQNISSVVSSSALRDNDLVNPPYLQTLQCPDPFVVKNRLKESKDKLIFTAIEWIFQNPQYRLWRKENDVRLLWIKGGAGKGKTMMTIGLVEQLSQEDSSIVAYFFCQNADYELNSIEGIIKGLILQLIRQRKELLELLQHRWDATHARFKENISSWRILWDIFLEMINHCMHQRVYVVVDALDECRNEGMAEFLRIIVRTGLDYSNVRWLLTSRPLDDADRELLTTTEQVGIGLELNADHLEVAIKTYVRHKVSELYPVHRYGQQMPQKLQSELLKRAEGTFLWAGLVCKRLESDGSGERIPPGQALLAIQDLPPGLHPLYERMLQQILKGEAATVHACLRLLKVMMLVYRPLKRAEVFSVTGLSESEIKSDHVVDRCASFIKMRGTTIEFVHQSSRDFLAELPPLDSYDKYGHGDIALSCLAYMSTVLVPNLVRLPLPNSCLEERDFDDKGAVLETLDYAATLWADHLEAAKHITLPGSALDDRGEVMMFIRLKFPEWLECLSLLDRLPRATISLETLARAAENPSLQALVYDANRVLMRHYQTISIWPLQIYSSVVVFCPERCLVRDRYNLRKASKWLRRIPQVERIWNPLLRTLEGHSGHVTAVAFSPDGKWIVSASIDKTVRLWDVSTGNCIKTFSPDGKQIASASMDETIRLWDASTGGHLRTLEGHSMAVLAVAFSPDGKQIASASMDETIRLWDASTGDHQRTLEGHLGNVKAVAFSLDGSKIASASYDTTVRLWDASTGNHQKILEGHSGHVTAVAFSPDSKQIVSASVDTTIRLWDVSTGVHLKTLEGHVGRAWSIAFSPDGRQIASSSGDKTIRLWDASTGDHRKSLESHSDGVLAAVFSPDGKQIASASVDKTIRLWDASMGNHQKAPDGHLVPVKAEPFSLDRKQIAPASFNGEPWLYGPYAPGFLKILGGHSNIASASDDKTVRLWDARTGNLLKVLEGHIDYVEAIAFSPDGRQIASASNDKTVRLWNTGTGSHLKTLEGHSGIVWAISFSPDGKQIASASNDSTVRLWDTRTGSHLKTLEGHLETVWAIAFSPDGKEIASASDKSIKLWDFDASLRSVRLFGRSLGALRKFREWRQDIEIPKPVTTLRFSEDGQFLSTNLGLIKLGDADFSGVLSIKDDWICYGMAPVLRLQTGLMPRSYDVRGETIAIVFTGGLVLCFEFDFGVLNQLYNSS
ncbi:WD40-repeat-containing domain protein [Aspergillus varians]